MIYTIASTYGYGIAIDTLHSITGWNCSDSRFEHYASGVETGAEAQQKMGYIMDQFWRSWDGK